MDSVKYLDGVKTARRGPRPKRFRIGKTAFAVALPLGLLLSFSVPATAHKESGYRAFAKLSNSERVLNKNICRKYGGRPVGSHEPDRILNSGRTDTRYYNVVWFEQRPYVSFKIDRTKSISGSIGLQPFTIWLCQF